MPSVLAPAQPWYPPLLQEDTHGCACQSGRAAGIASVFGSFEGHFRRPEGAQALERYTTGLLTARPTKNRDTMAQAVPGTRGPHLPEFLTHRPWEAEALPRQRVHKMSTEATAGDGVLVLEETGFPTQGQAQWRWPGSTRAPWAPWAPVRLP
jgi:SRSO17 transposase